MFFFFFLYVFSLQLNFFLTCSRVDQSQCFCKAMVMDSWVKEDRGIWYYCRNPEQFLDLSFLLKGTQHWSGIDTIGSQQPSSATPAFATMPLRTNNQVMDAELSHTVPHHYYSWACFPFVFAFAFKKPQVKIHLDHSTLCWRNSIWSDNNLAYGFVSSASCGYILIGGCLFPLGHFKGWLFFCFC